MLYGPKAGAFTELRFLQAGKDPKTRIFDPTFSRRVGKGMLHTVTCFPLPQDLGIRFLPWHENRVTCMQIDGAATRFFTGPLTGCAIYVGEAADGSLWAFHVNRNNSGSIDNNAVKQSMVVATLPFLPASVKLKYSAVYKKDYNDEGFFFGVKKPEGWKFYVADTASEKMTIVNSIPRMP